ncbi:MAG TPA: AEC family transporter [Ruminococcaceae bacterium]|nr:AEC family transporter [Oscillospiraceae bacterium]
MAPSFLIVLAGCLLKKAGIIDDRLISSASRLNFKVGFSTLIFMDIYNSPGITSFDGFYVFYLCCGLLAVFALLWAVVPRLVKDKRKASAIIQSAFKPNIVVLGYPIAEALFGAENMGAMAMVTPFCLVADNTAAVVMLSCMDTGGFGKTKDVVINVLKNPIIIASFTAVAVVMLKIKLPVFIADSVSGISAMAAPLALLMLGAQMELKNIKANIRYSLPASLIRVAAAPLVMVPLAVMLGFTGDKLASIFLISASPTATNSYIIAKEMHSDEKLTGQVVLMTTFFSMFTLIAGIYILKSLSLI